MVPITLPPVIKKPPPGVSQAQLIRLMSDHMDQGKTAIIDGKYHVAADHYFNALALPENKFSLKALEYFGLAKELNGESDAAQSIYTKFLQRYPEGLDHERVLQRLQSLQTAEFKPLKKLGKADKQSTTDDNADKYSESSPVITNLYGTFSNFYNGFVLLTDEGSEMVQSTIQADLYLTGRLQSGDWILEQILPEDTWPTPWDVEVRGTIQESPTDSWISTTKPGRQAPAWAARLDTTAAYSGDLMESTGGS